MSNFSQNNVNFTIENNYFGSEKKHPIKGKLSSLVNDYLGYESDNASKLINAVEIDWNKAELNLPEVFGGTQTISTTGQLLSIIQQLANAINNGSSQQSAISIDTQTTVNGIRYFAVSSANAGPLNLSTTAGTLNKTAFTMVANTPQSFTLSNVGSAGKTPNITISSENVSNNSCTIYVTSDIASTLYMGVDNGAFGDMTSYSYQTSFDVRPNETASLQWINTSAYTYTNNPRITAWQTSPGTTAQSIDYTITAQQNNDVYSISGTLPGGKGQSITSYAYFDINLNNTPAQTIYYWYVGQTNPSSMSSITPVVNDTSSPGWRLIGSSIGTYTLANPLWDGTANIITTGPNKATTYVALPNNVLKVRDSDGTDVTSSIYNVIGTKSINNVTYYIYSVDNVKIFNAIIF